MPRLTTPAQREQVEAYRRRGPPVRDRAPVTGKGQTAVIGAYAIKLSVKGDPIWIADYVLMAYGTGAIMPCLARTIATLRFAIKYGLPSCR